MAAVCAAFSLCAAPLRVGIDLDGEPMTFVNEKGMPSGFAVDIVNAIAREMKFEVVYVARPWAEMLESFKGGELDVLANMTYTKERAQYMEFTEAHIVMKGAIFVRKDDTTMRTPGDLRQRRVAVKIGSGSHQYLVSHNLLVETLQTGSLRDSLRAVSDGRADAVLDARIIGLKNIRDERIANVEAADIELMDFAQRQHIALRAGNTAQLALFNEGLARLRANGTYDKIQEKWIEPLDPRRVRLRELRPYFLVAALVLTMTFGALVWQRRLLGRLARQARALSQSEERLKLVLEGSDAGFWDWDMRSNHVERSERWATMLGYTLAEIPPTLAGGSQFVHPDDLHLYESFHSHLNTGERSRYEVEYRMRAKSGEWRWTLNRGKIVGRGEDGTPLRMAGTHTDITDLKRARETAAQQEARLRFIYEHAPVGLSWLRRDDDESRLVNPAHERITGVFAAKSRASANYLHATHPDDREREQALRAQLYRGEIHDFSMEKRYVHADGKEVWAFLTMHLYHDPVTGEIQEVTTLADINDLKRTEADREKLRLKMLEAQKLESLGVLAGGIAHDFNNLLTVILANATLVRGERGGNDERLAHIETAARRAADLCRQMLAYAGKGNFLVEHVDLGALVRDTARLLHISISKKAQLELELAPGLPAVEADPSQLRQVVMNLVINASEALGDAPGYIRIATRLERPEPTTGGALHSFDLPTGACVCLEIADTGAGMNKATIARIFDPFFTTKFTGRGLGLAAVLGIVRAHHGALAVESTPGVGTVFRLYLPASTQAPSLALPTIRPARPDNVKGRILIADDEPAVLAAAEAMLRFNGYQTIGASDGHAALARFRENPGGFAAILLDLTMPGLDGAEVLRVIRSEAPEARVLVMSGYSEMDVLSRMRGLGHVSVLRKPFTQDLLLAQVADISAGHQDREQAELALFERG